MQASVAIQQRMDAALYTPLSAAETADLLMWGAGPVPFFAWQPTSQVHTLCADCLHAQFMQAAHASSLTAVLVAV